MMHIRAIAYVRFDGTSKKTDARLMPNGESSVGSVCSAPA
jgi:hypothetical protein